MSTGKYIVLGQFSNTDLVLLGSGFSTPAIFTSMWQEYVWALSYGSYPQ